tara:strand:+ start:61 stop:318 length:258 start_codon:yes stop_codon:yes gene_type:complete
MSTTKQKLPDWFDGELYKEGSEVTNPYSGESIELNNVELSMYDFVMGATFVIEMGSRNQKTIKELQDGLYWFRKNNAKAYMILLD